ncbi:MAG: hypothetical protein ACYCX9_02290 [Candidatus Dormibacteria bacterium]
MTAAATAAAALGGVAVGAGLLVVLRRDRSFQLLACLLVAVAVALAMAVAGAVLPAIGALLLGGVGGLLALAPLARDLQAGPRRVPRDPLAIGLEAAAALFVVALLVGAGVAARASFHSHSGQMPSLGAVGHQVVLGAGVPLLGLVLVAATVLIGTTALVGRDRREVAEDQAEAQRRRRSAEQQRRARQRAAAREAARQARRGAGR